MCRKSKFVALAALLSPLVFIPGAKAEVFVSRYDVRLAGIHMGEATVHTALSAKRYKVAVSADFGVLFINEKIRGEASGSRIGAKLVPEHFSMTMSGGEDRAVEIHFAGSMPHSTKFTPPLPEEVLARQVPLKEAELRGLLDPLSALLTASLKLAPAANPCHSALPVYMGQARIDISLHPKAANEPQRDAAAVTCQARLVSIGGARAVASDEALQNIKPEASFVRLPKPNLWLLQHLSLPALVGTVTVERLATAILGS